MRILCMRHGDALAAEVGQPDEARQLSPRGRDDVQAVSTALCGAVPHIDQLFTSPVLRAVQTAELVAVALGYGGRPRALPELSYKGDPEAAARLLLEAATDQTVLAVGHMPTLPITLRALSRAPCPSSLQTAQVVCVEDERPSWTLRPGCLERVPL